MPLLVGVTTLIAQSPVPESSPTAEVSATIDAAGAAAGAAAGLAGCAAIGGCWLLFLLTYIGIYLFLAIWTMRDAKNRQSPNAQLVTVLAWIPPTSFIAFIVHLATRPKGNLVPCPTCQKKRLEGSATCPHCGNP